MQSRWRCEAQLGGAGAPPRDPLVGYQIEVVVSGLAGRDGGLGDRHGEKNGPRRHLEVLKTNSSWYVDAGDLALGAVEGFPVPLLFVDVLGKGALRGVVQRLVRPKGREALEGLCHR